jgi:hypothetical protein
MILTDNRVRRTLLLPEFSRRLVRHQKLTRVRSICKRCEAQFIGNADRVMEWEDQHYDTCKKKPFLRSVLACRAVQRIFWLTSKKTAT